MAAISRYASSGLVDRAFYSRPMRVAACQAPLLAEDSTESIGRMQQYVRECETHGISVLCFPEAILGGLADFSDNPSRLAIRTDDGQLTAVLDPLASDAVTSIVGFTELGHDGALYNAAAVYHRGRVTGVYRKIHPAIRQSIYRSGSETPVFCAGEMIFGILICNDSNYPELTRCMAVKNAAALFIPTNNSLPNGRASLELNAAARITDIALAARNKIWVIRADVVGQDGKLTCFGSSGIVDPEGNVIQEALLERTGLLVAEIDLDRWQRELPTRVSHGCGHLY